MSCPVCAAGAVRPKLRKAGVVIQTCDACGLAWWDPGAAHRAESVYDGAYFRGSGGGAEHGYDDYGGLEGSLRRSFALRIASLPAPGPGERLLDVGAAYGFAVDEARRAGWSAWGIDVSRAAARRARAAAGRMLVASALCTPFPPGAFQVVTLWDVLEHLPDPRAAVAECARLLGPGGRLVLTTGDVGSAVARLSGSRWHLYTLPEHLFFFSRRSLEQLLEREGLRVASMRAEGARYTLGYLAERLRKSLLGGATRPLRFPGAGLSVPLNLYDIVRVDAVRA